MANFDYKCRSKLKDPKIVAMVSIYDAKEFIKNRIENLQQSSMKDKVHIYCFDANSPGKEWGIVRDYADAGNITYVKCDERFGLYKAWNYIIQDTKNEGSVYLHNANCDDIVSPDYHQALSTFLDHNEKVGLVYTAWYITKVVNQLWGPGMDKAGGVSDPKIGSTCGHFPMWRRSLHDKHGLFDDKYRVLGDSEWWGRLKLNNVKIDKVKGVYGRFANRGQNNLYYSARDERGRKLCQTEEQMLRAAGKVGRAKKIRNKK